MCLNPSLERVKFVLELGRYGVSRCVEYTRKDLPWLKELAQRERERQRKLHELVSIGGRALKASPGRHCTWCPLLLNDCPVAETNPYGQIASISAAAKEKEVARLRERLADLEGLIQGTREELNEYAEIDAAKMRLEVHSKALARPTKPIEEQSKLQPLQNPNADNLYPRITILAERISKGERLLEKVLH